MDTSRRGLLAGGLVAAGALTARGAGAETFESDPSEVLDLWPEGPPGGVPNGLVQVLEERSDEGRPRDRAYIRITRPTLSVFRPARPDGSAVLILPGGGYARVAVDKEGFETARWLAARGTTVFVGFYRLAGDGWAAGPDAPLQDAQRALRLVRSRASDMGLDAKRVGVLGFSAGGHLAARLATRFHEAVYPPVDPMDALSARPDFAALGYPVITLQPGLTHAGSAGRLLGATPSVESVARYSADTGVTPAASPTFLFAAADDPGVPVENSLMMFAALKRNGVPSELHVFEEGGHGFGLHLSPDRPAAAWPKLFHD
jgi:acetyl esterase/lipase